MKRQPAAVYGHRLAAARPTLWVPALLAGLLSLPVVAAMVFGGLF
ncbi:hypothetical protein [Marimonas arenosa]|uniref:Uncharacterized protein n=1 Tax=Marimonas arenosa TaxID=1795305 RepID=A0AAE3W950_9RHOB|nr:hypothetical protein [Marimonas arenosa]MDQ2088494.1 hypothetical protein [Marimonas arenosa]